MISRSVEISITGGREEMVRVYLLVSFLLLFFSFSFLFFLFSFLFFFSFFLSFFFLFSVFLFSFLFDFSCYICLRYNSHVSASYVDKKPPTTVHLASPG